MGANQVIFLPVLAITWTIGCILLITIILVSMVVVVIRRRKVA